MNKKFLAIVLSSVIMLSYTITYASETDTNAGENVSKIAVDQKVVSKDKTPNITKLSGKSNVIGQIELEWPHDARSAGYIVYKYDLATQTYKSIKTITDSNVTTFTDKNVAMDSVNYYQVTPMFAIIEQKNSEIISVKSQGAKPSVTATTKGTTATLKWNKVTGAEGYEIYRSESASGEFALIGKSSGDEYIDTKLANAKKYFYRIRAYAGSNVSQMSDIVNTSMILSDSWSTGVLAWPVPSVHRISDNFGQRAFIPTAGATSDHQGIDITCPTGTNIVAADSGTVTEVKETSARGKYIVIRHANGLSTLYQHLSSTKITVGETVERGQSIGGAGSTGISTGSHLHFEVHKNGTPVSPKEYFIM